MDQVILIFGGVLLSLGIIALVRWHQPRHELIVYGIALAPTAGPTFPLRRMPFLSNCLVFCFLAGSASPVCGAGRC